MGAAHPEGLTYANELVALVRSLGDFCVGVAAFPDKHPGALDLEADARRLVEKCDAGADFAITQFFFSADAYFRLRDRVAALGCNVPILPGIMPVTQTSSVQRMAEMSGAVFPEDLAQRLAEVGDDAAAVRAIGVEVASDLATQPARRGRARPALLHPQPLARRRWRSSPRWAARRQADRS